MTAEVSLWAYPWDLHDIGLDLASERMRGAGVNMVSVATSYHAGRFLQPGNPRCRVYFPEDGTVYYRPDPAIWAGHEIRPLMAQIVEGEGDMLDALVRRRDAGGMGVSCWTVCLHNTRLGMLHPGHVMRTAHGDPHSYALCPSSPAARAYVTTMAAEIGTRYRPDRIELESPDFMGFAHGFHHEKDGLGLLPEDEFLLGLCFCDHCLNRATAAGVPIKEARRTVAGLLDAAFSRELPQAAFPDFPAKGLDSFAGLPALRAFLDWRPEPVTSLIAEIRAATPPGTRLLLIDAEGTRSSGINLPSIVPHVDGILHCAYFTDVVRIGPLMAATRTLLGADRTLIAGFQLFHPNLRNRADLEGRVGHAIAHVNGFNFYNLGLVPPARLDWIRSALGPN